MLRPQLPSMSRYSSRTATKRGGMFAYVFARHDWDVTRYSDGKRRREELCGQSHYDAVLVSYRFDGTTAWS